MFQTFQNQIKPHLETSFQEPLKLKERVTMADRKKKKTNQEVVQVRTSGNEAGKCDR